MADEEVISANNNYNNNDDDDEVFVYMGGDMVVPRDVVHARVHPSVTIISTDGFMQRKKLEEVELKVC